MADDPADCESDRPYQTRIKTSHMSTSTASSLRSPSPSSDEGSKRSFRLPGRSLTTPITPSSPEMLPQDSAFPIFPTRKAQATPTSATDSHYPPWRRKQSNPASERPDMRAPSSARDNVLQRMNSIAPGPFHTQGKGSAGAVVKRATKSSSNEGFVRPPSSGNDQLHESRPSTAAGVTRNPSLSSIAGGPKSAIKHDRSQVPALPANDIKTGKEESLRRPQSQEENPTSEKTLQEHRSSTFPLDKAAQTKENLGPGTRTSAHRTKPSMSAAATRPLDEIGSFSTFKPSRSLRSRGPSPAFSGTAPPQNLPSLSTNAREDQRLDKAPPVPNSTGAAQYGVGNPYHTPNDSISSNGSSGSEARTGSSRSSPPLNESPERDAQPRSRPEPLASDINARIDPDVDMAKPMVSPLLRSPPMSFSRPMYSHPSSISPLKHQPEPIKHQQSTRGEPAPLPPLKLQLPQFDRLPELQFDEPRPSSPLVPPEPSPADNVPSPNIPLQNGSLLLSPAIPLPPRTNLNSPSTPSTHSRTPVSPSRHPHSIKDKGLCRGCSLPIKGKSVSSADGQLTGRYHKQCFICKTCKSPFQTSDFYVWGNEPYCKRDYHIVNGSVCGGCERGIEGEYLQVDGVEEGTEDETKDRKMEGKGGKWHVGCFVCSVCLSTLALNWRSNTDEFRTGLPNALARRILRLQWAKLLSSTCHASFS